jgi:hypothetical protein
VKGEVGGWGGGGVREACVGGADVGGSGGGGGVGGVGALGVTVTVPDVTSI